MILSSIVLLILIIYKLKTVLKTNTTDKVYLKGETVIKGQEMDLLHFMQNPKNLKNWNNNITDIII